jgi:hypothetical protein
VDDGGPLMLNPEELITHKLGPFPVAVWGILAAGGVIVVTKLRGGTPAASAPVSISPAGQPGQATSGGPPVVLNPGQGVYDPGSGATSVPQPGFTAKELGDLFNGLQGPVTNVQYSGGGTTFGVQKNDPYQEALDAQTAIQIAATEGYWETQAIAQKGYWDNQIAAQDPYYQTQQAALAAYLASIRPQTAAHA